MRSTAIQHQPGVPRWCRTHQSREEVRSGVCTAWLWDESVSESDECEMVEWRDHLWPQALGSGSLEVGHG